MFDTSTLPSLFSTFPFFVLLGMVATGPVLYPSFWHRYYPMITVTLAATVVGYYIFILGDIKEPLKALEEYVNFILLMGALYVVSGTIMIHLELPSGAWSNLAIFWTGAILSNLIGTTGASILLIRPYMRLNKIRLAPYHIVFFIFMVSNVGGVLSPVGDPPLFLGYTKGVNFSWPFMHGLLPWFCTLSILSFFFYRLDHGRKTFPVIKQPRSPIKITIQGKRYFALFFVIIGALFLDINKHDWIPTISYHEESISFLRELVLLSVILVAYFTADKKVLKANHFSWEPLKEVACIFIGIFGTMMPTAALVKHFAEQNQTLLTPHSLYWVTGFLSSFLDNAPTYLSLLTAGMASKGLDIDIRAEVVQYSQQYGMLLQATSLAAVFFGAMTYIGNGPNFMVRAIAEQKGVKMPSFGSYILHYALRFLLPSLFIVWTSFIWLPSRLS